MADRRSVRSSSRRITPTPQTPSTATTPQPARASRRRGTRSQSHDVESVASATKATRRSARQASVASEGDQGRRPNRQSKRTAQKQDMGDLTTVHEVDTQVNIEGPPETPLRSQREAPVPHRSPGAVSEMSGTTAISSFSMVDAEDLEPSFIQMDLPELYTTSRKFLDHLASDSGLIDDDLKHFNAIRLPDSKFTKFYRFYDEKFNVSLGHFRNDPHQYIGPRAVRRALLGPDRDPASMHSGIDLTLYKANILVFAKQMIHSEREQKNVWDVLLQFDTLFPSLFLPALVTGDKAADHAVGESRLLKETFDFALELRTQLAILVLMRAAEKGALEPDETLREVFFHPQEEGNDSIVRGWDIQGLGGKDSELPEMLRAKVVERINQIRQFFPMDSHSLERGETVDFDSLCSTFSWQAFILQLLHWVRLRNREIEASIKEQGGITAIAEMVEKEIHQLDVTENHAASVAQGTPRKKRTSFGPERRRSSRKYDSGTLVDDGVMGFMKSKERRHAVQPEAESSRQAQQLEERPQNDMQDHPIGEGELQPISNEGNEQPQETTDGKPSASAPERSTAEILQMWNENTKTNKENHNVKTANQQNPGGIFDRQPNAERVQWDDGLEGTQTAVASSSKGKQPQQSSPRKRRRSATEGDIDDDEGDFETENRSANAQKRRQKAPVKRVRIGPSSSAPPSHQPQVGDADRDYVPEQEESLSEVDAPEMTEETEEAPPSSSFAEVRQLASMHSAHLASMKPRKARSEWLEEEEEALLEYMRAFPQKYSKILEFDKKEGYKVLGDRNQVQLKDKVRNMAISMIKSQSGLKPGFKNVVTATSAQGRKLIEDGYEW